METGGRLGPLMGSWGPSVCRHRVFHAGCVPVPNPLSDACPTIPPGHGFHTTLPMHPGLSPCVMRRGAQVP
jgi:hypothetical protein